MLFRSLFLLYQVTGESKRGANVLDREIVIVLDLLECHARCEASNHYGNRGPRATDDGYSVAHARVNEDTSIYTAQFYPERGIPARRGEYCAGARLSRGP